MRLRSGSQSGHERSRASASTCAFIRGAELPLTPAVWHKGPRAWWGARPLTPFPPFLPPSLRLRQTSEQKQGLSLPSASTPMSGPRRGQQAPLLHLSPALPPSLLRTMLRGQSSLPSDQKHSCWDFRSDRLVPQPTALAQLPFTFFGLSPKLVRLLTFKIPKYL